ncbi:MAG: peptide deformylase [Tannerella sp.]|jgi:peptide deformylase|nr:peptide deformylase [Tannerella sp.]
MILPIYIYGQPVLREESEPVGADYPNIKELVGNMFDTMYNADGIGLAAPQVGLPVQLFVIDADTVAKNHPECRGFKRVMINPEILERSDETVSLEEGCLSFPGIHEKVARAKSIKVRYMDENFKEIEEYLEGFSARVVQHEYEHLTGHVFIDDISPIRRQLNRGKLNSLIKGTVSCDYKIKSFKK